MDFSRASQDQIEARSQQISEFGDEISRSKTHEWGSSKIKRPTSQPLAGPRSVHPSNKIIDTSTEFQVKTKSSN